MQSLGSRHGALPEDEWLHAGEINDGRGRPRERTAVDDCSRASTKRLGHIVERRGIPFAWVIRARCDNHAHTRENVCARSGQLRYADADCGRVHAREPGKAPSRIRNDQRVGPANEQLAGHLRDAGDEALDVVCDQCAWLLERTALQRV